MLTIGPLGFTAPWALALLGTLLVVWWLLRLLPPAPRRIVFPPVRLLSGLRKTEEESAYMPPWLLALRLLLLAVLILAAAHPVWEASRMLRGQGPVVLLVDDGWAAARDWEKRRAFLLRLLTEAEREERVVTVLSTARRNGFPEPLSLMTPTQAREAVESLEPKPWGTDFGAAAARLDGLADGPPGHVVWVTDGLGPGPAPEMLQGLRRLGMVSVAAADDGGPLVLRSPKAGGEGFMLRVERVMDTGVRDVHIRAVGADGRLLFREALRIPNGAHHVERRLVLEAELRNRVQRIVIEDEETAGAVVLVDERWRRRPVGLAVARRRDVAPLLSPNHYLSRALEPFTEVREGTVSDLLGRHLAVLLLADPEPLSDEDRTRVGAWVDAGGILVRFAGPRLAREGGGALLPVRLRPADRTLGGALSWRKPANLAPFAENSPFRGLPIPANVTVRRQVLAEPELSLGDKTWAKLVDGTPLVTAAPRGKGWSVLVHTAIDPSWSSLPLSGLFVDMLRRTLDLSRGIDFKGDGLPLAPVWLLDGFGRLGPPRSETKAVTQHDILRTDAGPGHPPGIYGAKGVRHAVNLSPAIGALKPMDGLPAGFERWKLGGKTERDLRTLLLIAALVLMVADMLISLGVRGLLRRRAWVGAAVVLIFVPGPGVAEIPEGLQGMRLAYVVTADPGVDETSAAGLFGIGTVLNRRTSVRLDTPLGVNPETDELAFYPLLYWPLIGRALTVTDDAAARVRAYLRGGGVILFDRRDGPVASGDALAGLAGKLGISALVRLPGDHVLRRTYYLLREISGRRTGRDVWIEPAGERVNDGVSAVIAGDHDWAGAWAVDDALRPMFPVVPGGERQREMAYRFGINVVMYALTGNYKSDQVHLPTILKRLGQ